jgi:uncharacterized protein DUF3768
MVWFKNYYLCAHCKHEWIGEWGAACDDNCPHCGTSDISPFKSEDLPGPQREASKIAELNDSFRRTFRGGTVMMTPGVEEMPDCVKAAALVQVANFKDFNEDNDPHGEHDFGSFEMVNRRFFWKIDYYDKECRYGSEDPANAEKTSRVLTLMLASDY